VVRPSIAPSIGSSGPLDPAGDPDGSPIGTERTENMSRTTTRPSPRRSPAPGERFARDRRRYVRIVLRRYPRILTPEDAEDIVSEALIEDAAKVPRHAMDGGRPWFARVVLNRAEDYRRARDGRPRSQRRPAPDHEAPRHAGPRTIPMSTLDENRLSSLFASPSTDEDDAEARERAQRTLADALERIPAEDARLLRLRFLDPPQPRTRQAVADELGLSLTQYESRHTQAWKALVAAIAEAHPTDDCVGVRAIVVVTRRTQRMLRPIAEVVVDSHLSSCTSCRLWAKLSADDDDA